MGVRPKGVRPKKLVIRPKKISVSLDPKNVSLDPKHVSLDPKLKMSRTYNKFISNTVHMYFRMVKIIKLNNISKESS